MIVLDRETRSEIEDIIQSTISQLEIRSLKEINKLTVELVRMPQLIADGINRCKMAQQSKRRWGVSTMLSIAAILIAVASITVRLWLA